MDAAVFSAQPALFVSLVRALTYQAESPEVFVLLDAFIGRMRLISSRDFSQVV